MTIRRLRPRSVPQPGRDSRRRTPDRNRPLPPPAFPGEKRRTLATARWGEAWTEAVERHAADRVRLSRGRAYARGGYVTAVTAAPGRISASVRGSRPRPYRADIFLPVLTAEEWDAFFETAAAEPAHIAALLDHDVPPGLAEAGRAAGVRLLPAAEELRTHCSCPDDGDPCKHVAALAYETARLLDDDPFLLLLLRGRDEDQVSGALTRRNAAQAADTGAREQTAPAPTVGAATVLADRTRPALPAPLPPPPAAGEPTALPDAPAPPPDHRAGADGADPLDPDALAFLAADAAARAHDCLTGTAPAPVPALTAWQDAVRLAATHPRLTGRGAFSLLFARLAEGTGGTTGDLTRAAAAWRQGGAAGLTVLQEPWDPPAGDFDRARSALAALGHRMTINRNRLTAGRVQLRYGRDGRWYRYTAAAASDDYWPDGPADRDPVVALRGPAKA